MKPILFNTEMVRAILDGRKTVTRRVVKPQPICHGPNSAFNVHDGDFFLSAEKHWLRCRVCGHDPQYSRESSNIAHHLETPYSPGDILYVRETWRPATVQCNGGAKYFYFADGNSNASEKEETGRMKWHPSIHMPKEAARIFLRVTDVRVERLRDITGQGLIDDGLFTFSELLHGKMGDKFDKFGILWDSTIKPADLDKYGWNANPWVFVIEFERCEKQEDG